MLTWLFIIIGCLPILLAVGTIWLSVLWHVRLEDSRAAAEATEGRQAPKAEPSPIVHP